MNEDNGTENLSKVEASVEFIENQLKWMTSQEAAVYLRVSVGQVRNLVWRGQLKYYRLSNRLRFLRKDLDDVVKSCK